MKIAHITKKESRIYAQDLKQHLIHTALLCSGFLEEFKCPVTGYILGLTHDVGKAGNDFQDYMITIKTEEVCTEKKVNHSSAGAVLLQKYITNRNPIYDAAIQMLSEVIFSHHSALPDNISKEGKDGYASRLSPDNLAEIPEVEKYFFTEVISKPEFEELLKKSCEELQELISEVRKVSTEFKEFQYTLGLAEKYLLSSLIDADWLDSFWFEEAKGQSYEERLEKEITERRGRKELYSKFSNRLEERLHHFPKEKSALNIWRTEISKQCKEAGSRPGGVYTLACPTGSGKTLSSIRFALEHCIQENKSQIFYIIPFLSIIDQNVESIKKMLRQTEQDELVENSILELHSAKEGERKIGGEEDSDYTDFWARRMTAPIVFTTMTRFLNTFFAKGTKNLRPMHQFQSAVVIFDEIQSLNIRHIAMFNGVINFLANVCNCTCILCTATQPLLGEVEKPAYPIRFQERPQLVTLPKEAWQVFRRTKVIPILKPGNGYNAEQLAELLTEKAEETGNALLIMNTKNAALQVFEEVEKRVDESYEILYLSTRLYPLHRKEVILQIRQLLEERKKVIVVSTQIVEAGVDFDFKCVIRSLAGLDSIVQAAGRCNREGQEASADVYIVNPDKRLEHTERLKDIEAGKETAYRFIMEYEEAPERFENELLSEKAIRQFFQYYFKARKEEMACRIKGVTEYTLYDLLADNQSLLKNGMRHYQYCPRFLNQAFKEASENFTAIEQNGQPVFVSRKGGKILWERFQAVQDLKEYKRLFKQAQQYVINVNDHLLQEIKKEKGVLFWDEKMNMYVVNEMYYHEKKGLSLEVRENIPLLEY